MTMNQFITPIRKDTQAFWVSFVLCLVGCGAILLVVAPLTGLSQQFGASHDGYIQLARSLVRGDGYRFAPGGPLVFHRPPAYPLFLVPVALFPVSWQAYVILLPHSLLVGLSGLLLFRMGRVLFGRGTAHLALLLFLINPWVYWNAKNPMTPVFQMTLYLLFLYLFGSLYRATVHKAVPIREAIVSAMAVGLVAAVLSLSHAAMLPVSVLLLTGLLVTGVVRRRGASVVSAIIAAMVTVAVISPWTIRNYRAFHRFIPIAGGSGLAYFNGHVHWQGFAQRPQQPGESYINASLRAIGIDGTHRDDIHWMGFKAIEHEVKANRAMIRDIKQRPAVFAKKVLLNAVEYYFPAITSPYLAVRRLTVEQVALTVFHLLLWLLAVLAMVLGTGQNGRKPLWWLLAAILLYAIWYFPFATFIGHSMYTLGTIPLLSMMAAAGGVALFGRSAGRPGGDIGQLADGGTADGADR